MPIALDLYGFLNTLDGGNYFKTNDSDKCEIFILIGPWIEAAQNWLADDCFKEYL